MSIVGTISVSVGVIACLKTLFWGRVRSVPIRHCNDCFETPGEQGIGKPRRALILTIISTFSTFLISRSASGQTKPYVVRVPVKANGASLRIYFRGRVMPKA